MRTKLATTTMLVAGLLVLAFSGLQEAQARPQWDACIERITSKEERIPRYNGTCHQDKDGDWCWGHGNRGRRPSCPNG